MGIYFGFRSLVSSDLVYVLLFPQLLLIIYWNEHCNAYGCVGSLCLGFIFRVIGKYVMKAQMFEQLE